MTAEHLVPPPDDRDAAAAAAARFAATAPADLVYAEVDSPVGRLLAAATPRGLATLSYEDHHGGLDAVLDALAAKLSPRIVEAPARLDDIRRELDEYFEGRRTSFDLRLDWALTRGFTRRVLQATARIPYGGERARGEPDPDRRAVPPGPAHRRRARRLHRRRGPQAGAPDARRRPLGLRDHPKTPRGPEDRLAADDL